MDVENPIEINLSEEEEKNIIAKMQSFLEESENFRQSYEDKWFDYYINLRNYKEDLAEEEQWKSNIHMPLLASQVYTVVPLLAAQYINPIRSFARILPVNVDSEDDVKKAKITEKIVTCQFRRMKYDRSMVTSLTECVTYGTAWQKVTWKKITKNLLRPRRIQVPLMGSIMNIPIGTERKTINIFDGPYVEPVDLFYFYPDKNSTNIDDMTRYIHKAYLYPKNIKELIEVGIFKSIDFEEIEDYSNEDKFKFQRLSEIGKSDSRWDLTKDSKRVEIIEYYDNGEFWFILNRKKIVRHEYEPFWRGGHNIILYQYIPNPFEIYGIGLAELLSDINADSDFLHNSRNDWISFLLRSPIIADKSRFVDEDVLRTLEPFSIVDVNAGDDISKVVQQWPMRDVYPSFYREQDVNHSLSQMITGINDYIKGQNAPSMNDTATGISIISRNAMNRMTFHMQFIACTGVTSTIEKIIDLNNQKLTREQRFNITDEESIIAGPDDIIGEFDVIPRIDANQSTKDVDRQQFVSLLQTVGASPMMSQRVKWGNVLWRTFKMFEIENPKELIISEEELQQQMLQQQMMNQQISVPFQPQSQPVAKQPPYAGQIDMTKMMSRRYNNNRDKIFEGNR